MISRSKERKVGVALSYTQTALSAIISIIYIPLLLNGIGKSEYGLYQLLGSVIAYFSTMYSSLNSSVMKYYTEYLIDGNTEKMENTLFISRRVFNIISILLVAIAIPVGIIFRYAYRKSLSPAQLDEAIIMFAIMIANILVYLKNSIYSASIMSNERFIFRRSLDVISQILQPIAVILFIKRYPYALTIVTIQLTLNCLIAIANYIYVKKQLNVRVIYHGKDTKILKGLLSLSGSVLFVSLADQIFWKTDQLILGQMYGAGIVAVYSIGSQLNSIYISVGIVMGGVLLPMLTKVINEDDEKKVKLSSTFAQLGRYQSFILMLVFWGIILFGKEFILILSNKEYLPAYYVALLLMIPYTVDLIQNSGNSILQAQNLYWYRARILFIAALINVVLTYILSKYYGMYGAAFATSVSIVITSWIIMNKIYMSNIGLNIKLFWKSVVPIWLVGLLPAVFGYLISKIVVGNIYITFIIHVLLFVIVYGIIVFLLAMRKDEKKYLFGKLYKKG